MVTSACLNYITTFVMVISFVSAIGDNLEEALASKTGQPWVTVVYLVTGSVCILPKISSAHELTRRITPSRSKKATIVLTVLIGFQFTFTSINQVTTSSRQLWAFARDKGLPFHQFLSRVSSPINTGLSFPANNAHK